MLEERRTIERAKSMLIERSRMAEPDAYRWLRRRAMNENRRIVDVARELLDTRRRGR
jgi:response regulator NasT